MCTPEGVLFRAFSSRLVSYPDDETSSWDRTTALFNRTALLSAPQGLLVSYPRLGTELLEVWGNGYFSVGGEETFMGVSDCVSLTQWSFRLLMMDF